MQTSQQQKKQEEQVQLQQVGTESNKAILEALDKLNNNLEDFKAKTQEEFKKQEINQNEAKVINAQSILEDIDEESIYQQRLEMLEIMGKADREGKINLMNFDTDAMAAYMWQKKFGLSAEEVAKNFDDIKGKVMKLGSIGENFVKSEEAKKKYR